MWCFQSAQLAVGRPNQGSNVGWRCEEVCMSCFQSAQLPVSSEKGTVVYPLTATTREGGHLTRRDGTGAFLNRVKAWTVPSNITAQQRQAPFRGASVCKLCAVERSPGLTCGQPFRRGFSCASSHSLATPLHTARADLSPQRRTTPPDVRKTTQPQLVPAGSDRACVDTPAPCDCTLGTRCSTLLLPHPALGRPSKAPPLARPSPATIPQCTPGTWGTSRRAGSLTATTRAVGGLPP